MGGGKKEERDGESERKDGRKRKTEVKGEGRGGGNEALEISNADALYWS